MNRNLVPHFLLALTAFGCQTKPDSFVGKTCDTGSPCPAQYECRATQSGSECMKQDCGGARDCSAGFLCIDKDCRAACVDYHDCGGGESCPSGTCVGGAVPSLTQVSGNGAEACPQATLGRCMADGMIATGTNLHGATFTLEGDSSFQLARLDAASDSDTQVALALPAGLTEGSYTLRAVNAAGSALQQVSVLQGPPGPAGGVGGISLIAVGAAETASLRSIRIGGVEYVDTQDPGLFVVVYDMEENTVTLAENFDLRASGQAQALCTALGSAPYPAVVLAAAFGASLFDNIMHTTLDMCLANFGASALSRYVDHDAYAFIGTNRFFPYNAFETLSHLSNGGVSGGLLAMASTTLADGVLLGLSQPSITDEMHDTFVRRADDSIQNLFVQDLIAQNVTAQDASVLGNLQVGGAPVLRGWNMAANSCSNCDSITVWCPGDMVVTGGGCELFNSLNGSSLISSAPLWPEATGWTCRYTVAAATTEYWAYALCARAN